MSLSSDMNDPRRNLSALRWDAAWIDPALRRMAEAAAQRAGLPVEAWIERAIRKACNMPAVKYVAPPPAPAPRNFSTALHNAEHETQRQPLPALQARAPQRALQPPPMALEDEEPLALTQPIDPPPRAPMRRPVPPPPVPPTRGMSVFWAAGIAAVLAFIAVTVVRDPGLLHGNFLASGDDGDRAVDPPRVANADSTPLRVSPRPHPGERTVTFTAAPTPATVETADNPVDVPAAAPVETKVAVAPPAPVAKAPAPSAPPTQTTTAAVPPVTPAPAPVVATNPAPVQMAALPTQSPTAPVATDAPQAPAPAPVVANAPVVTPPVELPPVTPEPVKPATVAAAPKPAAPPIAPQPAPVEKPQQVAMAPAAAPAPAPAAPAKQDGPGAQLAADARMAAELDARVKAGDHVAEYRLGILYALGKGVTRDYDHAAQLLHASAASGLPEAEYDYGVLCDKGLGVPRDAAEAARWYQKAALQGHPPAALNLGYAYAEGLGVVRNLPEAAKWFRRAAEAGLINAQFNLAYMYEQGAGLAKSQVDAYAWYSVAAEKGDQGAQQAMDRIAVKLTPHELQLAKTRIKTVKHSIRVQN